MTKGTPVRYGPYRLAATVTDVSHDGKKVRIEFDQPHYDPEWVDADKCYDAPADQGGMESLF